MGVLNANKIPVTDMVLSPMKLKQEPPFPGVELIPGVELMSDVSPLSADVDNLDVSEIMNSGTFANLSMSDLVQGTEISLPNTPMKPSLQDPIKYSFDGRSIFQALKQEHLNEVLIPIPSPVMNKLASPKTANGLCRKRNIMQQTSQLTDSGNETYLQIPLENEQEMLSFIKTEALNNDPSLGNTEDLNCIANISFSSIENGVVKDEALFYDVAGTSAFGLEDYKVFNEYLMSTTPVKAGVPMQPLTFSPSQFLNTPTMKSTNALTSTPKRHIQTPTLSPMDHADSSSVLQTPKVSCFNSTIRTPTPIKEVLDEVNSDDRRRRIGNIRAELKRNSLEMMNSSRYDECDPTNKENIYPPKRARKALHKAWMTDSELALDSVSDSTYPETPSKSLLGDSSVAFSPPSIIKETLMDSTAELNTAFVAPSGRIRAKKKRRKEELTPRRFDFAQALIEWERKVTNGRTVHQEHLTELARQWVSTIQPRSLQL
ncbi:unnamed protein product [Larinioides sclopetarius]|uniref:Uncharacterized protein n=1 Tax=Larinioides sclopetarius TaxID=280406 RepID=A0AAV2BBV9_9ARAC